MTFGHGLQRAANRVTIMDLETGPETLRDERNGKHLFSHTPGVLKIR